MSARVDAPNTRIVDALSGRVAADHPVLRALSEADEFCREVANAERLRDENRELHIRVNEAEEELGVWRDEALELRRKCAALASERDTLRAKAEGGW